MLVTTLIQNGLSSIYQKAFAHIHKLDLSFHNNHSSREQVFAINRALNSLETGLRFFLGFFSGMVLETTFISVALGMSCGPQYMINALIMLYCYVKYTREKEWVRMNIIR